MSLEGVLALLALLASALGAPLQTQQISLEAIVTPSTVIMKDGRPVTFALHGFIEFKSLAEMFPYIESQTRRWPGILPDTDREQMASDLLRRGIESRVVSMADERPLEALLTHTSDELRRRYRAREGADAARLCRRVSCGTGEMEAFGELLERCVVYSRARAFELVSHRGGNPTLWRHLRFDGTFLASGEVSSRHYRGSVNGLAGDI